MKALYDAALLPLRAASLLFGMWPRADARGALERDQRLGRRLPVSRYPPLWLHGASVGEARIVSALAREIRRRRPGLPLAASAMTATGRAQLPDTPEIDGAFVLPLDFRGVQRRAFDAVAPAMIAVVETELWPNLFAEARARAVPVALVNARLAPEKLVRYRRFAGLYGPILRGLAAVGAASPVEAGRFESLGVSSRVIRVTGNVKFDLPSPVADRDVLRLSLRLRPGRAVVAAGSTGEGEDRLVLDAFMALRGRVPEVSLLLAPRHPQRFDAAVAEAARRGLVTRRLAAGEDARDGWDVLVVDTIGDLATLYAATDAAFVGGSLVPIGGHNLLEPPAAGVPVLFGPHTFHVAEVAESLEAAGAGERVLGAAGLADAWERLLTDPSQRAARVGAASELLAAHRGALARTADLLLDVLDSGGRASSR